MAAPHAHVMLTMRPFDEGGEWGAKQKKEYILDGDGNKIYDRKKRQYKCKSVPTTDWNDQTKAEEWRAAWAQICNQHLGQNEHAEHIDHRSYERQGIDQIPTVHLGVAASAMGKCASAPSRQPLPTTFRAYCHARHRRGNREFPNRCITLRTQRKC